MEKKKLSFGRLINYANGGPCVLGFATTLSVSDLSKMDEYHFLDAIKHPDQVHDDAYKLESSYPRALTLDQKNDGGVHILIGWEFSGGSGTVRHWVAYEIDIYTSLPGGTPHILRMHYDEISGKQAYLSIASEEFEPCSFDQLSDGFKTLFNNIASLFDVLKKEKVHV